ncbi:MauE/DoxX family redox-associated membrane protein [Brevibacillus fortis]|uniref:MauE/DoxX family redox-associated membrane protein n=1 Tax=Brevibacillus fortis TaxID=2126352 RepID=UPI0038FD21E1
MEFLSLIIRITLITLFISTSLSKFHNIDQHALIIKEYKILPNRFVYVFAKLEVYTEFSVGIFLALGLFPKLTAGMATFLLLIYTLAISINLLRGRRNISCGCGGIAGNHHLSWLLVLRNVIFICIAAFLIINPSNHLSVYNVVLGQPLTDVFNIEYVGAAIITIAFIVIFQILTDLIKVRKRCAELLSDR